MERLSSSIAAVVVITLAGAVASGCDDQSAAANDESQDHSSLTAESTGALSASQTDDTGPADPSPQNEPTYWTLQTHGLASLHREGHSAMFTYVDRALQMRLLNDPSKGGVGQGLSFHLPDLALGFKGKTAASNARLILSNEGLSCSMRGKQTHLSVTLTEFTNHIRQGSFEGRLRCKLDDETSTKDDKPKYIDLSGKFRHN